MVRPRIDPSSSDVGQRLYRNVYQFDVKMMYPSFVDRFKIDPCCLPEGGLHPTFYERVPDPDMVLKVLDSYARAECGFRPAHHLVELLIRVRKRTKKLKKLNPKFEHLDNAVKAVLNALAFGVMGKRGWGPLGNDAVAEAIFHGTRAAQYLLFYEASRSEVLQRYGCRPIYSDTDSIYITCARRLNEEEINEVLKALNSIIEPFGLELDFEGEWELMYIHGKKNYILVGKDKVVIKGSYFHRLVEYELPPILEDIVPKILRGEATVEEALKAIDSAPLDEVSIEMHNMISRTVLKTEKERNKPKVECVVKTPWEEVPYGRLLRLHTSGFVHPRRVCLLAEALRLGLSGDVRLEFDYYDGLQILDARGLPGWGTSSNIVSRICGYPGALLVERGRVYCVKLKESYYILEDLSEKLVRTFFDACPGNPMLRGVLFRGFSVTRVEERVYRGAVKNHVRQILSELEKVAKTSALASIK